MMEGSKRLSVWFYKITTGWISLTGLMIFLLFVTFVLPEQAGTTNQTSSEVGSPDTSFYYTPGQLYEMAEAYGEQGRANYIQARFSFDLIWPLIYTLFLVTAISWLFKHASLSKSRWHLANIVPALGMAFDYLENISTALVMYRYPTSTDILAIFAPIFTSIKWIFIAGSFGLLAVGLIVVIWHSIKKYLGEKS